MLFLRKFEHQIKKLNLLFREAWVSDPGTGTIGFVSKFCAMWWYLCVRISDMEPNRAKINFGTPLATIFCLKYARILLGIYCTGAILRSKSYGI